VSDVSRIVGHDAAGTPPETPRRAERPSEPERFWCGGCSEFTAPESDDSRWCSRCGDAYDDECRRCENAAPKGTTLCIWCFLEGEL
jgi:hypothetical protein